MDSSPPSYDPGRASKYRPISTTPSGESVISLEIQGRLRMKCLVMCLWNCEMWYAIQPLPNEVYMISVLEENQEMLKTLIRGVNLETH